MFEYWKFLIVATEPLSKCVMAHWSTTRFLAYPDSVICARRSGLRDRLRVLNPVLLDVVGFNGPLIRVHIITKSPLG